MDAYLVHVATLAGIYALMTMAFNVAVGYTGVVNFGHIGLMGIGAYASAILSRTYDWPVFVAMASGALLACLTAMLLAIPTRTIRNDYYALVSLGFLFVVSALLVNGGDLTRGTLGLPGIPRPEGIRSNEEYLFLVLAVLGGAYLLLDRLLRSPFGRALEAVRDDEEVAESLGKPVFKLKVMALAISGALVGLSGALLAHYIQFISPSTFWLDTLVWGLAGMIIGGLASLPGSVLGAVFLFLLSEPIRFLDIPSTLIGPARLMLFLSVLIAFVIYRPRGFLGRAQLDD